MDQRGEYVMFSLGPGNSASGLKYTMKRMKRMTMKACQLKVLDWGINTTF